MAIFNIFPEKSTTLYSNKPEYNFGMDEQLELINNKDYISKILLKFHDKPSFIPLNSKKYLKLKVSNASGLVKNDNINLYYVDEYWEEGIGNTNKNVSKEGASWNNKTTNEVWNNDFVLNTPIINSLKINDNFDLNLELIDYNDDIEGLLLCLESSKLNYYDNVVPKYNSFIKYFSNNTHTIYAPLLEFKWDDSEFDNSSELPEVDTTNLRISISNNPGEFIEGSVNKFRINVQPKNLPRTYSQSGSLNKQYILPEETYYSIRDLKTNEVVIDFDPDYTKISCDSLGNYFNLYTNGLQPERNYEILLLSNINDEIFISNDKSIFKIKQKGYNSNFINSI